MFTKPQPPRIPVPGELPVTRRLRFTVVLERTFFGKSSRLQHADRFLQCWFLNHIGGGVEIDTDSCNLQLQAFCQQVITTL